MSLKRVLLLGLVAFVVYYILRSPDSAASAFRVAGQSAFDGLKEVASSLARFFDKLFA